MNNHFFVWLLDNQCLVNNFRFAPFIEKCIDDTNLFSFNSKNEFYNYLYINGYDETVLKSFLYLWHFFKQSS